MMEPIVREMILCEDARTRPGTKGKIDVFGIMNRALAKVFPFNLTFSVYLCLTDCRGSGRGRIVVKKAVDEEVVYVGDLHRFEFGDDPLALEPFLFRVFSCPVPTRGLYSVDFEYNDVKLESCLILVE
jgi:hypothetical protein